MSSRAAELARLVSRCAVPGLGVNALELRPDGALTFAEESEEPANEAVWGEEEPAPEAPANIHAPATTKDMPKKISNRPLGEFKNSARFIQRHRHHGETLSEAMLQISTHVTGREYAAMGTVVEKFFTTP